MAIQDSIKGWPWYGQVALFVVISGILFFLGNKYMVEPKKAKITQLEHERESLIQEINKGETLKARYIEFEAELKRLESQLETLKKILPESEEIADLYSRIQQEGTELGLNITNFKPGAKAPQQFYEAWPIAMTADGNYHILAKFFERLGKLYRIINVNDVTIKALPITKTNTSNSITATCIATTFIYKEEAAKPTKTTTKPKK